MYMTYQTGNVPQYAIGTGPLVPMTCRLRMHAILLPLKSPQLACLAWPHRTCVCCVGSWQLVGQSASSICRGDSPVNHTMLYMPRSGCRASVTLTVSHNHQPRRCHDT